MKIAKIGEIHKKGLELIQKDKYEIIDVTNTSEENLKKTLSDVDAIAIRTANLSTNVLKVCSNLKIISRHGVGYDNVDINYLNKMKIPLAITGTANANSVAEHVMMMILGLSRRIIECDKLVKNNRFIEKKSIKTTHEISKKNILILGFGRIGKELQKKCKAFNMNILIYDPYVSKKIISEYKCHKVELIEGIKQADYISIHMPLNKDTKNIISKEEFKQMKKNCIIINTARGEILNQEDLLWALNNDIIYGAGLDVYKNEPPDKSDLILKSDKVILTPHNSALTIECRIRMGIETIKNILDYFEGKPILTNIVNKEIL